jgi:acetyl-CoA acyltransferase 1
MATQRIKQIAAHLVGVRDGMDTLLEQQPDDVVITLAIRSPLCKGEELGRLQDCLF